MRLAVFMDLDDAIFQTRPKCRADGELADEELVVGALGPDGRPLSFLTPGQDLLWRTLAEAATIVPVTARSLASFQRVTLPFNHGAVLDFGGLTLEPSGEIDQDWLARMGPLCRGAAPLLTEALYLLQKAIDGEGLAARPRLVSDAGLIFYVLVKTAPERLGELEELEGRLAATFGGRAVVRRNGNNLALLPPFLDKGAAVERFIERHLPGGRRSHLILGLGDSLTDRGFLALGDYFMVPVRSQLGLAALAASAPAQAADGAKKAGPAQAADEMRLAGGRLSPDGAQASGGFAESPAPGGTADRPPAVGFFDVGAESVGAADQCQPTGHAVSAD
ncbi:MAG: hypothetical protein LBU12_07225, partial [Deltaproteobacteria bacterium]|nr:hypothetical protein [Deltaproteobacteria bacterium]